MSLDLFQEVSFLFLVYHVKHHFELFLQLACHFLLLLQVELGEEVLGEAATEVN